MRSSPAASQPSGGVTWELNDGTAGSASNAKTICTLAKTAATNKFLFKPGTTNATGLGTTYPTAIQLQGWVTQNAYSGDFASGNWTVAGTIQTGTTTGGAKGKIAIKIWRCTAQNLGGTNTVISPTGAGNNWNESAEMALNVASQTYSYAVAMDAVTVTSEYIYVEFIWNITVVSSKTAQNVILDCETSAEHVDTTNFTVSAQTYNNFLSDSVASADDLLRMWKILRNLLDSESIADNLSAMLSFLRNTSDSIAVTDTIGTMTIDWLRKLSDDVAVSENLVLVMRLIRGLADSLGVSDSAYTFLSFLLALADSMSVSDTIAYPTTSRVLRPSDSVAVTDDTARVMNLFRQLNDALTVASGDLAAFKSFLRQFADAFTTADVMSPPVASYDRRLSDGASVSDAVRTVLDLLRQLSELINIEDIGILAGFLFQRSLGDSIAATDQIGQLQLIYGCLLTDVVSVADDPRRVATLLRRSSDSIAATDALATVMTYIRTASDSISVADDLVRFTIFLRRVADSLGVSDSASKASATLFRQLSDAIGTGDAVLAGRLFSAVLSDILATTDAVRTQHIVGAALKLFERLTYLRRSMAGEET